MKAFVATLFSVLILFSGSVVAANINYGQRPSYGVKVHMSEEIEDIVYSDEISE